MDLHRVETYLRPTQPQDIPHWESGWAWLAGGTWLFTEPQPHVHTLVDMQRLGWDELDATADELIIGATCTMSQLLAFPYPPHWSGFRALQSAVHELASFKIQNMATIAGNLCLALPASTFAPVMVLFNAHYDIRPIAGDPYTVSAQTFQTGAKTTLLQPGDVLRRIRIPADVLEWRVSYRRICVATAGIAVSIVVAALNPKTGQLRFGIGSCIPAPRLIEWAIELDAVPPTLTDLQTLLDQHISLEAFIDDETASADYRRHVTAVLMQRSLDEVSSSR